MEIPLEKVFLILCWKDNPLISFTNICRLLRLEDISIIAKFFVSQKIFPDRPYYILNEIKQLLRISTSKLHITETSEGEYISREDLLRHILTHQYDYDLKFRHFLSCFYKQLKPNTRIKCFLCRRSSSNIIYPKSFTPICVKCHVKKTGFRWKRRNIKVSKVKYRKLSSKRGFTRELRDETSILLNDFKFLPLINSKRINTIKDCTIFYSLDKYRGFLNRIPFRVLMETRNESGNENRWYHVRCVHRPRIRKR